ncbi:unnamed protein product [Ectocarpus sp. 12 AP-2014]
MMRVGISSVFMSDEIQMARLPLQGELALRNVEILDICSPYSGLCTHTSSADNVIVFFFDGGAFTPGPTFLPVIRHRCRGLPCIRTREMSLPTGGKQQKEGLATRRTKQLLTFDPLLLAARPLEVRRYFLHGSGCPRVEGVVG